MTYNHLTHGVDREGNIVSFEDMRKIWGDTEHDMSEYCCIVEGLDSVYDWYRTSAPGANMVTYKINMIHMHQFTFKNQPFYDINVEFVDGVATVVSARHAGNRHVNDDLLEVMSKRIAAWFALHNIDQYESGGRSYKQVMATFSKLRCF